MNILICIGSYRRNGNTAHIAAMIEEELARRAADAGVPLAVEIIFLAHEQIGLCRGCRVCFDKGETLCPLHDDFLAIKAKMVEADGLLVASPIYVNDVSGTTKNWIDRLAHVCHRPQFAGKCTYLVTTIGSGQSSHALRTLGAALQTWGFHIVGQTGFKTGALMDKAELRARFQAETARIAGRLFDAIQQRRFANPSFLSLMTFRIQQSVWQQQPSDTVDYRYWASQGWLAPEREFYIAHHANRLKVLLARLAGAALGPFVS